jgi:hypothetical protein
MEDMEEAKLPSSVYAKITWLYKDLCDKQQL